MCEPSFIWNLKLRPNLNCLQLKFVHPKARSIRYFNKLPQINNFAIYIFPSCVTCVNKIYLPLQCSWARYTEYLQSTVKVKSDTLNF